MLWNEKSNQFLFHLICHPELALRGSDLSGKINTNEIRFEFVEVEYVETFSDA